MDYESYDALGLAALVAKGETTPVELLDAALARVAAWNPHLNAVVNLQEETARQRISAGLPEGPFRGVPFLLKDLGIEAEAFPTDNGSRLQADTRFAGDAELVQRLDRTGLVTFGRTTAPEGGIGPVTEAAVYGGPTRNPWGLGHTPGGSSGGAGAAVAAGILPAAHGSDGGGSVRIPASSCGLFGMKPTRARLPEGPYSGEGWAGMAIDGFLTRSVRDSAALLDACAGPDLGAPYWVPPMEESFSAAITHPPRRLKIGISTKTPNGGILHPDCAAAVKKTAEVLADLGHQIEEASPTARHDEMMAAWTKIVACGTKTWVRAVSKRRGIDDPDQHLQGVARGACKLADTVSGADYLDAVNAIHTFGREMAGFYLDHDIWLTATLAEPPAEIGRFSHDRPEFEDFEHYRMGPGGVFDYSPFTAIFNASGQPAASVPMHWNADNLPIGVQISAAFGEDALLISLAAELEQAAPWFNKRPALPD